MTSDAAGLSNFYSVRLPSDIITAVCNPSQEPFRMFSSKREARFGPSLETSATFLSIGPIGRFRIYFTRFSLVMIRGSNTARILRGGVPCKITRSIGSSLSSRRYHRQMRLRLFAPAHAISSNRSARRSFFFLFSCPSMMRDRCIPSLSLSLSFSRLIPR